MGRRKYRDITIRGVTYPTAQAAARALGVQEQTVHVALRAGALDTVGMGSGHRAAMPVRVLGKTYPSARAAAAALGCTRTAIYRAITEGREDRFGTRPFAGAQKARAIPVSIAGMSWPSMAQASRALGFDASYVSHALSSGSPAMREALMAAAMRLASRKETTGRAA